MKEILQRAGYALKPTDDIWCKSDYDSIAYNDGDEVEQRIAAIIRQASDITVLSTELRQHCTDWPSLYHLSGTRANILRPLGDYLAGDILEIGAGCGAITRYLGERGAKVLALEGSVRRAAIARSRTRDLENVTVLAEKFDQFHCEFKFDCITLIGVLEYANLFTPGDNPAMSMLARVRSLLKPAGRLIIAIENQLGLKYFAGAPEDHIGQPMYGLESRYKTDQPQTFGRRSLETMLNQTGFGSSVFMAPFPDYKLPASIVTEAGFSEPEFDASALAWQSARRDPQLPPIMAFSPELVWPSIFENKIALDLANSFLIAASEITSPIQKSKALAYHYSTDRRKEYCKETTFIADNGDGIKVLCQSLSGAKFTKNSENIIFGPESESDYVLGTPLSWKFIKIISSDGWKFDDIVEYFRNYLDILSKITDSTGKHIVIFSNGRKDHVLGQFIDAIPQNIICLPNQTFRLIDTEWRETENIPIARLLLRSILWQLFALTRFGQPAEQHVKPHTRKDFVIEVFNRIGLGEHIDDFPLFFQSEAIFQEVVTGRSAGEFMEWWPNTQLPTENLSLALPLRMGQLTKLNQVVTDRDAQIVNLNQAIADRDAQLTRLNQAVTVLHNSRSWRYTEILRKAGALARPPIKILKRTRQVAIQNGGYKNLFHKVITVAKREGLHGVYSRLFGSTYQQLVATASGEMFDRNDYQAWIRVYDTLDEQAVQRIKEKMAGSSRQPKISVVMPVYNAPLNFLEEAIRSVQNQIYQNWELCISDDASTDKAIRPLLESFAKSDERIKVVFREKNGHISSASNSALDLATGEFIALLDNDDLLPRHALYHVSQAILKNPDAVLIYSDEDKINASGERYDPYFKCEFNYELFLAQNMICHLGVYKSEVLRGIKGFRIGFEGAQDYDLALRVIEGVKAHQIVHIPHVLYHWRAIPGSTALDAGEKNYAAQAARQAISEHLERTGRRGSVSPAPEVPSLNRIRYAMPDVLPLVSIIIPTRDRADLLRLCLDSVLNKTSYPNYEVLVVDNGSIEEATHQLLASQPKDRVRVIRDETPFNYSRLNNLAVLQSKGEVVCLMNNDIEILTPDWLEEMLAFALQEDIGCVGARLWYPDGRLQHGGVILGIGGVAGHSHKYVKQGQLGYFGRASLHQSLSSVTGACLVIRRSTWEQVNGLDNTFSVAFNDVDFCLRVLDAGYRNVWTPYAEMNHHESASRGLEDDPIKIARFQGEIQRMQERWGMRLKVDPAYSPNLTLDFEDFSLAWPPR